MNLGAGVAEAVDALLVVGRDMRDDGRLSMSQLMAETVDVLRLMVSQLMAETVDALRLVEHDMLDEERRRLMSLMAREASLGVSLRKVITFSRPRTQ